MSGQSGKTGDLAGSRALITGGAGLVGSHIADALLAAGAARVVLLDDLSRGRRANVARALASGRCELVEGDLRDAALVERLVEGADLVFHQAALRITQCAEEPRRAVEVMVDGSLNVLEAAARHGVRKVVAASTASVYGEPERLPIDEDHPFRNRTLYGGCKIALEQMLRAYADMRGLAYVALRYFNVYGPRMDSHGVYMEVLPRWARAVAAGEPPVLHGDGLQSLDLVHVVDVARANLLAATVPASDVAVNVGSGRETTLRELARLVVELSGRGDLVPRHEPERKVNPVRRRLASLERARALLGYEPSVDLGEGVAGFLAWLVGEGSAPEPGPASADGARA